MKYSTYLWCSGLSFLSCCAVINASNHLHCPSPDVPANGKYEPKMNTFLPRSNVSYTCNDGFALDGSSIRECQFNGTWSQNTPFCDREMRLKTVNARAMPANRTSLKVIDENLNTGVAVGDCPKCVLQLSLEKEVGVYAVSILFMTNSSSIEIQTGEGNNMTVCMHHNGSTAESGWTKLKCDSYAVADKIKIRYKGGLIMEVQVFGKYDYGCSHPPEMQVANGYFKISRTKATLICEDGYTSENGRLDCEWNSWNDLGPRCVQVNLETFKNKSRVAVIVAAVLIIFLLLGNVIYLIRKQRAKEMDRHTELIERSKISESRST